MIEAVFGPAEYDRPKVYEAGFIHHGLPRGASLHEFSISGDINLAGGKPKAAPALSVLNFKRNSEVSEWG